MSDRQPGTTERWGLPQVDDPAGLFDKQTTKNEWMPLLRAQSEMIEEMRQALENINRRASPSDRTLDQCAADLYWCACEARRVLA